MWEDRKREWWKVKSEKGKVVKSIKLAHRDGGVIDQTDEADITEDFFVVTDYKMSDYSSDHGSYEHTSWIQQDGKGGTCQKEGKDETDPADHFDQGDGTNDAGTKIGDPTHAFGENIDWLKKADTATDCENEK